MLGYAGWCGEHRIWPNASIAPVKLLTNGNSCLAFILLNYFHWRGNGHLGQRWGAPFSTGIPGLMLFPLILAFCPGAGVAQFIDTIMVSASAKANPHQIRFLSIRIKVDVLILNKDYT
jgi:hypothetical protein